MIYSEECSIRGIEVLAVDVQRWSFISMANRRSFARALFFLQTLFFCVAWCLPRANDCIISRKRLRCKSVSANFDTLHGPAVNYTNVIRGNIRRSTFHGRRRNEHGNVFSFGGNVEAGTGFRSTLFDGTTSETSHI